MAEYVRGMASCGTRYRSPVPRSTYRLRVKYLGHTAVAHRRSRAERYMWACFASTTNSSVQKLKSSGKRVHVRIAECPPALQIPDPVGPCVVLCMAAPYAQPPTGARHIGHRDLWFSLW